MTKAYVNMFALLLWTFHLLSLGLAQVMITNGPNDTTVCSGGIVNISCGFSGADPSTAFPDWIIVRRSDSGSVISTMTISGDDIVLNNVDGLQWVPDLTTGGNNAPNSYLIVGPVDESDDQSSYQCRVTTIGGSDVSTIGTLTVAGIPTVDILMARDNCLNVNASWTPISGVCSNSVQYMITLSSSSGLIEESSTDSTVYTSNSNTSMLTGNVSGSVVAFNGNAMGTSTPFTAQLDPKNRPRIIFLTVVKRCVSYVNIYWNDTTGCRPVIYTVMLVNSSGEMLENYTKTTSNFNFTELTSNTSYTASVTGRNRAGQDDRMDNILTLESKAPGSVTGLTRKYIDGGDIIITWNAPVIVNACSTSGVSSYEVVLNYTINDVTIDDLSKIFTNTSILLSNFLGHPMDTATYNDVTVIAINEGGRSDSVSISLSRDQSSDDGGLSGGALAGIIVGVIAGIALGILIALVVFCCLKKNVRISEKDTPDSQNVALQDKNTTTRSGAEEQSLYSYARTGPINVVMEGGTSTRPGDKPRQT